MENLLKNEIIRKLSGLNFATIDLHNGGHTSMLHVGVSNEELLRRRKHDSVGNVSTFEDVNIFDVCIYTFINDNIDYIVKWLEDPSANERLVEEYFLDEGEKVGRVLLPNGGIKNTECYRVVLQKNDKRTGAAEMPFDYVNMFPVL